MLFEESCGNLKRRLEENEKELVNDRIKRVRIDSDSAEFFYQITEHFGKVWGMKRGREYVDRKTLFSASVKAHIAISEWAAKSQTFVTGYPQLLSLRRGGKKSSREYIRDSRSAIAMISSYPRPPLSEYKFHLFQLMWNHVWLYKSDFSYVYATEAPKTNNFIVGHVSKNGKLTLFGLFPESYLAMLYKSCCNNFSIQHPSYYYL